MENKKEVQELSQMVNFSKIDETQLEQSVTFDQQEDWVHISHAGNEISLSRENWEKLVKLASRTYSAITEQSYSHLKNLKMKDAAPILEEMTDLQIVDLIREDANEVKLKYWDIRGMTKLLLQELFKRNGLGYKSLNRLSSIQRGFVENLKIYEKAFYGKP